MKIISFFKKIIPTNFKTLIVVAGHDEFCSKLAKQLRSLYIGSNPVLADVKFIYKRENLISQGFSVFRL